MGSYDATFGPLLVGILVNAYLYGLVTSQFITYYRTDFNDRPAIKLMVLFLFVLDTFHSVSAIYMVWNYSVANFGNPAALEVLGWPYTFTPLGTALAALVTQVYLASRIQRLANNKFIYGVIIALAITSFLYASFCSIATWLVRIFPKLSSMHSLRTPLWLDFQVGVDIIITSILIILFTRARTGFRRTDNVINRLTLGAIQTGFFATICAGGVIIARFAPSTNIYAMFAIPLGRIYTITIMNTLLTRDSLRAEMAGPHNYVSSHPL